MREKYLNKEVFIRQKNGKQIVGKILYWVEEQGEREYILINDECIYADEIEFIELKDEHDFIRHFNKNVKVLLKNRKILDGHCEIFTRAADSDYNEPELVISTPKGHIGIRYSEVEKIEDK